MPDTAKAKQKGKGRNVNAGGSVMWHHNIFVGVFDAATFDVQKGLAAFDGWNGCEVIAWRNRSDRPFERTAVPWVTCGVTQLFALHNTGNNLDNLQSHANGNNNAAHQHHNVQRLPACGGVVMIKPARGAHYSQNVHWDK